MFDIPSSQIHEEDRTKRWKHVRLVDAVALRRETVDPKKESELPYVGLEHIDTGQVDLKRWGKGTEVSSLKNRFAKNDVLYGKLRPYLDKAVIASVQGLCSTDILVLKPMEVVLPEFIAQILHTQEFISFANSTTTGLNHPRTSWSAIQEFSFPLPPISEQREIAQVLSTIRRAQQATREVIQTVREVKESFLDSIFSSGSATRWPIAKLGDICERPQYGITKSASSTNSGPKFLRITDIQDGEVDWQSVPTCEISNDDFETYKLKPRDILIARIGATTGKTFLVGEVPNAVFGSYLIRLRAGLSVIPAFLGAFTETRFYWDQIEKSKGGRLKQGVNIGVIQAIELPLPSIDQQKSYVTAFDELNRKLSVERERLTALQFLYQTSLHELLSGRIHLSQKGD
jgi:type I restriction enzyme S subunit